MNLYQVELQLIAKINNKFCDHVNFLEANNFSTHDVKAAIRSFQNFILSSYYAKKSHEARVSYLNDILYTVNRDI